MTRERPRLSVLSEAQRRRIHEATLTIMENTGQRVPGEEAQALLRAAGCRVERGDIVHVPADLVEWALSVAPKRLALWDRRGNELPLVIGGSTYFAPGTGSISFLDLESGERRPFRKRDVGDFARLIDALPHIAVQMPRGVVTDEEEVGRGRGGRVHECEAVLANSTKPVMYLADSLGEARDITEMAASLAGGVEALRRRPTVIWFGEALSPLKHKESDVQKILWLAEQNLPCRYGPLAMAGASMPMTLAGVLAQSNAETLMGLVLSQVKRAGAPYLMGSVLGVVDMKTGSIAFSTPETQLLGIGFVQLAHGYGLPVYNHAANVAAQVPDQQAVLEAYMRIFVQTVVGTNLVSGVGHLDSGIAAAFETLVIADELIAASEHFAAGLPVDDESLAIEAIDRVGTEGNFAADEHTYRHYKEVLWFPGLLDHHGYESWLQLGGTTLGDRARARARHILETHEPEPVPAAGRAVLDAALARQTAPVYGVE